MPLELPLIRGSIVGGGAAGFAVHKAIFADANVELRLAQATEFFALALGFRFFALGAAEFGGSGCGAHESQFSATPSCRKHAVSNSQSLCIT